MSPVFQIRKDSLTPNRKNVFSLKNDSPSQKRTVDNSMWYVYVTLSLSFSFHFIILKPLSWTNANPKASPVLGGNRKWYSWYGGSRAPAHFIRVRFPQWQWSLRFRVLTSTTPSRTLTIFLWSYDFIKSAKVRSFNHHQ